MGRDRVPIVSETVQFNEKICRKLGYNLSVRFDKSMLLDC